jgi:hypothetical protein
MPISSRRPQAARSSDRVADSIKKHIDRVRESFFAISFSHNCFQPLHGCHSPVCCCFRDRRRSSLGVAARAIGRSCTTKCATVPTSSEGYSAFFSTMSIAYQSDEALRQLLWRWTQLILAAALLSRALLELRKCFPKICGIVEEVLLLIERAERLLRPFPLFSSDQKRLAKTLSELLAENHMTVNLWQYLNQARVFHCTKALD